MDRATSLTSAIGQKLSALLKKIHVEEDQSGSFPSQAVRNKYRVQGLIGRGSFGHVWLCEEKHTRAKFACKVIDKTQIKDAAARAGLAREVSVMQLVSSLGGHPGLAHLQEVFETEAKLELVMEYCSGGDLFDNITAQGSLPESSARSVFRQLASAVAFCHANGVVHRDIKAENVLLASGDVREEEQVQAKLCDFGLSRSFTPGQGMREPVGTKYWAAPEVTGGRAYSEKVDVWSLGVVLFCMLSGKLPPTARRDSKDARLWKSFLAGEPNLGLVDLGHVSREGQDLLRALLERNPDARMTSAEVLQHPWLSGAASSAGLPKCAPAARRSLQLARAGPGPTWDSPTSVAIHGMCLSPMSSSSSLFEVAIRRSSTAH